MFSFFLQLKYFPVKAWENRRESEKKYINIYIYIYIPGPGVTCLSSKCAMWHKMVTWE